MAPFEQPVGGRVALDLAEVNISEIWYQFSGGTAARFGPSRK